MGDNNTITASDIIRANSQAETKEAERIKQEAEHYKAQLDEIRASAKDYKAQLDEINQNSQKSDEKIHDIGVQVYRNVQAIIEKNQDKNKEEFKEIGRRLEAIQVAVETKNSAVLPILIITLLVAGADLVINLLRIFGILG